MNQFERGILLSPGMGDASAAALLGRSAKWVAKHRAALNAEREALLRPALDIAPEGEVEAAPGVTSMQVEGSSPSCVPASCSSSVGLEQHPGDADPPPPQAYVSESPRTDRWGRRVPTIAEAVEQMAAPPPPEILEVSAIEVGPPPPGAVFEIVPPEPLEVYMAPTITRAATIATPAPRAPALPALPESTRRYVLRFLKARWRRRDIAWLFDIDPDQVYALQRQA